MNENALTMLYNYFQRIDGFREEKKITQSFYNYNVKFAYSHIYEETASLYTAISMTIKIHINVQNVIEIIQYLLIHAKKKN